MVTYRIQDPDGRGPYRPGMSHRWTDPDGPECPPWWVETGESMDVAMARMNDPAMHYGCGFNSLDQLHAWFTTRELRTLDKLGFKLVIFTPDQFIARTPRQVVFGHKARLATIKPRVSLISSLARAV